MGTKVLVGANGHWWALERLLLSTHGYWMGVSGY